MTELESVSGTEWYTVTMTEKEEKKTTNKPIMQRVQFSKDSTAEDILAGIRKLQDEWAKENPERAHTLYPKKYPAPPASSADAAEEKSSD